MRLDGLPTYDKKKHGRIYHHAGTFVESDNFLENKKAARKMVEEYTEQGYKCIMERHGTGFVVYINHD